MNYSHQWGEEGFDWKGLDQAGSVLRKEMRRFRIPVRQIKEKFGQLRCYCSFGWTSIHDITHPGHAYIRYKKGSLLWHLNYNPPFNRVFLLLNYVVIPLHEWAYRRAYKKAVAAAPHLRGEITCAADFPKLLEGIIPTENNNSRIEEGDDSDI